MYQLQYGETYLADSHLRIIINMSRLKMSRSYLLLKRLCKSDNLRVNNFVTTEVHMYVLLETLPALVK